MAALLPKIPLGLRGHHAEAAEGCQNGRCSLLRIQLAWIRMHACAGSTLMIWNSNNFKRWRDENQLVQQTHLLCEADVHQLISAATQTEQMPMATRNAVRSMLLLWSRPEAAEIVVSAICHQKSSMRLWSQQCAWRCVLGRRQDASDVSKTRHTVPMFTLSDGFDSRQYAAARLAPCSCPPTPQPPCTPLLAGGPPDSPVLCVGAVCR